MNLLAKRRRAIAAFLGAAGFALFQGQAAASLAVSPSRTVFSVNPGETVTGTYTVTNQGDQPASFVVEAENWERGGEGGRIPADWLSFSPASGTLDPGQSLDVQYNGTIPDGAAGEIMAQVFFTSESAGDASGMILRTRLGTIIYAAVKGTEVFDTSFGQIEADYFKSSEDQPVPDRLEIYITLFNDGNVHVVPEGNVAIFDGQGQRVASFRMFGGWGLLPRSHERFIARGEGVVLTAGSYNMRITIFYGNDLGRPQTRSHEATLIVHEGQRLEVVESPAP